LLTLGPVCAHDRLLYPKSHCASCSGGLSPCRTGGHCPIMESANHFEVASRLQSVSREGTDHGIGIPDNDLQTGLKLRGPANQRFECGADIREVQTECDRQVLHRARRHRGVQCLPGILHDCDPTRFMHRPEPNGSISEESRQKDTYDAPSVSVYGGSEQAVDRGDRSFGHAFLINDDHSAFAHTPRESLEIYYPFDGTHPRELCSDSMDTTHPLFYARQNLCSRNS
jgi:hypothetical protein